MFLARTVVDGRYYHYIMVRSENSVNYWTKEIARQDAINLFDYEKDNAFKIADELRSFMAFPTLEELISQIVWRHQNSFEIGYDLLQYKNDLQYVRDLAVNNYNLNTEFIDEILYFLESIYPKPIEPKWYDKTPWSWLIGGITGALISIPITHFTEKKISEMRGKKTRVKTRTRRKR